MQPQQPLLKVHGQNSPSWTGSSTKLRKGRELLSLACLLQLTGIRSQQIHVNALVGGAVLRGVLAAGLVAVARKK